MPDLLTTRTIDVTKMALDGLMMRQKAITANTANVMTPDYLRKEVSFENQLKEIVEKDELKNSIKARNSAGIAYNPMSLDLSTSAVLIKPGALTVQESKYLQTDVSQGYAPQIVEDTMSGASSDGNNVNLEKEVMDMAKVGTQYTVLSVLEQKSFKQLSDAIKGTGQ